MNRRLDVAKQIHVIHNIPIILVFSIRAVDATDRLEKVMVTHPLVDVQIGCAGSVKARQQLVHNDEQFHFGRRLFEHFLDLCLKFRQFLAAQHPFIGFLLIFLLAGLGGIRGGRADAGSSRLIGSHHSAAGKVL